MSANSPSDTDSYPNLKKVLKTYYEDSISAPVKWGSSYDPNKAFCNPLQPVVGLSLFEAKAYVKWLSEKSQKNVRVVKFYPDFTNVVGEQEPTITGLDTKGIAKLKKDKIENKCKDQRTDFIKEYNNIDNRLFNCRTHYKCYYGSNSSSEPMTVGIAPNNKIFDLYDICGNIFEMQDDYFNKGKEFVDGLHKSEIRKDAKTLIEESALEIPEWTKTYCCSGGSWKHDETKFPHNRIGQFVGFTRNQDIGFRIVIDKDPADAIVKPFEQSNSKKKNNTNIPEWEDTAKEIIFQNNASDNIEVDIDLSIVRLVFPPYPIAHEISTKNAMYANELDKTSNTYIYSINNMVEQIRLFGKEENNPTVALVAQGYNIFAYELKKLVVVCKEENDNCNKITAIRKPLDKTLRQVKERSNKEMADEVILLTLETEKEKIIYTATRTDIASGIFILENEQPCPSMSHNKKKTETSSLWYIKYHSKGKSKSLFAKIKEKVSNTWYMPDWVDLYSLSKLSTIEGLRSDSYNKEDNERMMETLNILDTVDMHMSILRNKKI